MRIKKIIAKILKGLPTGIILTIGIIAIYIKAVNSYPISWAPGIILTTVGLLYFKMVGRKDDDFSINPARL